MSARISGLALLLALGAIAHDALAAEAVPPLNGAWQLVQAQGDTLKDARGNAPPLNTEGKKLYAARQAQLKAGDRSYDLSQKCKPIGFPRVLWDGGPFDIQAQPKVVLFGYTWNRNHRIANVSEDPPTLAIPRYYGTSTARWDGDTLVVNSGLFTDNTLLDAAGLPHGDDMTTLERYRVSANGLQLEVTLTIEDAKYYSKAWDVRQLYQRVPGGRILEDVCQERSEFYLPLLKGR